MMTILGGSRGNKEPEKKYEFAGEILELESAERSIILHRIRALRDFADVKAGDLGGWIENRTNLSDQGDCWVYDDAKVHSDAMVYDHARVSDRACIFGYDANAFGRARIQDRAMVKCSEVSDHAVVSGDAIVECAVIVGFAKVLDSAYVESSTIKNHAKVCDAARVVKNERSYRSIVGGEACICSSAEVLGAIVENATIDRGRIYTHVRAF